MERDSALELRIEKQADKIKDGYNRIEAWAIIEDYMGEVEMHSLLNQLSRIAVGFGEDKETAQTELCNELEKILMLKATAQATIDVNNNDDIEDDFDCEDEAA